MRAYLRLRFFVLLSSSGLWACGAPSAPERELDSERASRAIIGGTILSQSEMFRSGVVYIGPYPYTNGQACTASVLRTSSIRQETYFLTAAHCFDGMDLPVRITSDSNVNPERNYGGSSDVRIHPSFDTSGRNEHDLAIIRLAKAIPVEGPSGNSMTNWYRPMFAHSPRDSVGSDTAIRIFGAGCNDDNDPCDSDDTIRHIYDDEYEDAGDENVIIDDDDSTSDPAVGDSGGPWLTAYGTSGSTSDYIDHGIILAAHTGYDGDDDYAASTFASSNESFIVGEVGDSAVIATANSWTRPCFDDWCHYRDSERVSMIMAAIR